MKSKQTTDWYVSTQTVEKSKQTSDIIKLTVKNKICKQVADILQMFVNIAKKRHLLLVYRIMYRY